MSTDSTELTFVRCPSCRSLVPAAQKRCRMCGAVLDASGQPDEEQVAQKKPGRVKQRTISQPGGDLAAIVSQIRKEEEKAAKVEPQPEEEVIFAAGEELSDADPLGGFIGEEEAPAVESPEALSVDEELDELWDDGDDNGEADDGDEDDEELETADESGEESPVADLSASAEDEDLDDDYTTLEDDAPDMEEQAAPEPIVEPVPEPAAEPEIKPALAARKPGFIIETGMPRGAQRTGLSFGRPNSENTPASPKAPTPLMLKEEKAEVKSEQPKHEETPHGKMLGGSPIRPRPELKIQPEAPAPRPVQPEPKPQFQPKPAPVRQASFENEAPVKRQEVRGTPERAVHGRLFGWLVSYQDPDGAAIELREGRFFVSRSGLKGNDLILEDPSVATPHALLTVNQEKGLVVQDLMSERGVFVRRRGGGSYLKEELFQAQHGDWIRFGDVEFLISLIAHVGEK